jgi:hypothetical protein
MAPANWGEVAMTSTVTVRFAQADPLADSDVGSGCEVVLVLVLVAARLELPVDVRAEQNLRQAVVAFEYRGADRGWCRAAAR